MCTAYRLMFAGDKQRLSVNKLFKVKWHFTGGERRRKSVSFCQHHYCHRIRFHFVLLNQLRPYHSRQKKKIFRFAFESFLRHTCWRDFLLLCNLSTSLYYVVTQQRIESLINFTLCVCRCHDKQKFFRESTKNMNFQLHL